MKKMFLFLTSILLLLTQGQTFASESKCGPVHDCVLDGRTYRALPPDGWDGKSPLPVLMHFHGWGRQAKTTINHGRIAGATRKMGVLLLAPNGNGRTWSFWSAGSSDVSYAAAVLKDAAKRWPIDKTKIFVSGYSYGSAMAWRFACDTNNGINTLLGISGTLPDQDEPCEAAVNVRHVHGTSDNVMDYPFGPNGEIEDAVALWRIQNECPTRPSDKKVWNTTKILSLVRHIWANCASGKSIMLDVHTRGHFIPRQWIARQLQDLL